MLEYWLKIVLINFYWTAATSSYYTYPVIKQENNKTQLHVRCAIVFNIQLKPYHSSIHRRKDIILPWGCNCNQLEQNNWRFSVKVPQIRTVRIDGNGKIVFKEVYKKRNMDTTFQARFFFFFMQFYPRFSYYKEMTNTPPINTKWLLKRSLILSNRKYKGKLSDALVSKFVLNKVS